MVQRFAHCALGLAAAPTPVIALFPFHNTLRPSRGLCGGGMKILNPFNDTSSTAYKVVIKIIYGLIFVTLFTIVVDTLPALSDGT